MLSYYAEKLPAVEINNTFYRLPAPEMVRKWAEETPTTFRFALKSPRRITHEKRLRDAGEAIGWLFKAAGELGEKLGPVLFQLPPNLKKDVTRLQAFLALLPADHRAAFEFRNDSWFDDEVYAALRAAGASLCLSEREDNAPPPLVETAPWGYVRLRLEHYSDDDLAAWAARLAAARWQQVYVYFMHEPTAPGYATTLTRLAGAQARR